MGLSVLEVLRPGTSAGSVLVVDDSEEMREWIGLLLSAEGYGIEEAEHGADALARLEEAARLPDVIVLDLEMPVMNGLELLRRLRADAELAEIRVLLVSGADPATFPDDVVCLQKPFTPRGLVDAVNDRTRGAA
jgi:CheY-like chemotaxis protein